MTEPYDKYLPATTSDSKPSKPEKEYSPTDFLEPRQIKFAEMKVMASSLSDEQIGQRLNVEYSVIKKWNRNQHLKTLINDLKRKLVDQDVVEKMKKQTEELLDLTYVEAKSRFEDPFSEENARIYNNLEQNSSKELFHNRFAYFSSHDKLVRTFNELSKGMRMSLPENMEQIQEVKLKEIIVSMRNNYEEGRLKRSAMEKAGKGAGIEKEASPFAFKRSTQKKNQEVVDMIPEDLEMESVSIRSISIRTKNVKEEEDNDE